MAVRPPYQETSRIVPASTLVKKRLPIIRRRKIATTTVMAMPAGSIFVPFPPSLQPGNRAPIRSGVHVLNPDGLTPDDSRSFPALFVGQPGEHVHRLAIHQHAHQTLAVGVEGRDRLRR